MKNNFKYYLLIISFWFCSCSMNKHQQGGKEALDPKPNIVFILVDDAGWGDFSCYGQEKFSTPNIDQLAKSGMKFNSHYAGSTVCAPSRSTLMTGLHTGHSPIRGNKEVKPEGQVPIPAGIASLPKMMQSKGYTTGMFGKWGLGYPGSEGAPNNQGFDEFYGYNCQRLAHTYYPLYLRHNGEKVMLEGNEEGGQKEYTHHLIHDQALNFIDDNKDKPFFLYLPYTIPHAEVVAPEDSIFQHYKEVYPKGKPYVNKRNHNPNLTHEQRFMMGTYADQEFPRAAFATMMHHLDNSVGEIMDKLKEHGLDENTIIILTSDQGGFFSQAPLSGGKIGGNTLGEGGARVPMLIHTPDPSNHKKEIDTPVSTIDIFPTLMEIASHKKYKNTGIQGVSLWSTINGKKKIKDRNLYFMRSYEDQYASVIQNDWKMVKYHSGKKTLFNIALDQSEKNDLYTIETKVAKELEDALLDWENEVYSTWEKVDPPVN